MAKKQATKREFDWRTYHKPARILSPEQEESLAQGILAPLLSWAIALPTVRFEIRARQALIYDHGTPLLRIRGAEQPFSGEIDANVRLPRAERSGQEQLETWPLSTPDEVSAVLGVLETLHELSGEFARAADPTERAVLHSFSSEHAGRADDAGYLVVDTEYQYGRRRFDFVAARRAEGVAGPGGFTTPRLVLGQLKSGGRPLGGTGGLVAHAADFADFATALGGTHLTKAKEELDALVCQKCRLGLLPGDLPFRHFTADDPEYLVVLAGMDLADTSLDAPLAEMHEKLVARHYRPELLRLAGYDLVAPADSPAPNVIGPDDSMPYRAFKGMRKRLRG